MEKKRKQLCVGTYKMPIQVQLFLERWWCLFHQSVWGGALAGKSTVDVEALLDKGIYSMEKLKEGGWITDIKYADEVSHLMKP